MSTLTELMSRDPNDCDRAVIDEIVLYYRGKRGQFQLGDLKAGSAKAPSKSTAEALEATKKMSLGDLL